MIAVISDSHVPRRADEIPSRFREQTEEAEVCVHSGDLTSGEVLEELEESADTIAVKGNCDLIELESSAKFEFAGISFGVYHGSGIKPRGHVPTLLEVANKLEVEALIHGHTHEIMVKKQEGKLLLNPGSCTGVGGGTAEPGKPSMLRLKDEKGLVVEKLVLEDPGVNISRREVEP